MKATNFTESDEEERICNLLLFSPLDIEDPLEIRSSLSRAKKGQGRTIDIWLFQSIPRHKLEELLRPILDSAPITLQNLVSEALNKLITGNPIYEESRFREVHLRKNSLELLGRASEEISSTRLNRMLLEDAFPNAIRQLNQIFPLTDWLGIVNPAQKMWQISPYDIRDLRGIGRKLEDPDEFILSTLMNEVPTEEREWFRRFTNAPELCMDQEGEKWLAMLNTALDDKLLVRNGDIDRLPVQVSSDLVATLKRISLKRTSRGKNRHFNRLLLGECYPDLFLPFAKTDKWLALKAVLHENYYKLVLAIVKNTPKIEDPENVCSDFFDKKFYLNILMTADQKKGKFRSLLKTALANFLRDILKKQYGKDATCQAKDTQSRSQAEGDCEDFDEPSPGYSLRFEEEWAQHCFRGAAKKFLKCYKGSDKARARSAMSPSKGFRETIHDDSGRFLAHFRARLINEVRQTLPLGLRTTADVKEECIHLFSVLAASHKSFDPFE